jgi:hypothetical protein
MQETWQAGPADFHPRQDLNAWPRRHLHGGSPYPNIWVDSLRSTTICSPLLLVPARVHRPSREPGVIPGLPRSGM